MRSWLSVLITDAESKKVFDIPIAPSLYSLSNKMDNSLLAVRDINHKYIVVESITQKSIDKNESTQDNVSRETINSDTLDNQLIEQITSLINKQKFIIQIMDKDITRSKLEINNSIILMERLIEKVKKDI